VYSCIFIYFLIRSSSLDILAITTCLSYTYICICITSSLHSPYHTHTYNVWLWISLHINDCYLMIWHTSSHLRICHHLLHSRLILLYTFLYLLPSVPHQNFILSFLCLSYLHGVDHISSVPHQLHGSEHMSLMFQMLLSLYYGHHLHQNSLFI
jgi:hypothetical protein